MIAARISLFESLRRLGRQRLRNAALLVSTITIATAGSIIARDTHHPVTAAMIFVIAVLVNGSVGGLAMGLLSALLASFIFNVFIRFPVYVFGLSSIDDYVPVLALSTTAVISGVLSGRLADRARAAEEAQGQLARLLRFSTALQSAMTFEQVAGALVTSMPDPAVKRVLDRLERDEQFAPSAEWQAAVPDARGDGAVAPARGEEIDPDVAVSLLRMAIERCELLEEQARAQAAVRSEQFKTALLSSLSHDLRTPLAAISASADGLMRYGQMIDRPDRIAMMETIQEQCARLDRFTQKIVALARLEAGLSPKDLEIVDVEEALGSAIAALRAAEPARRIERQIETGRTLILAHPALLEQVLFNVMENALRYSAPDGAVTVRLADEAAAMLGIVVADEGVGIAPQHLPHIFERFYRGGNVVGKPGQGLGLSIAKTFVDAMGGAISAISPAAGGRGTELRILLPRAQWREPQSPGHEQQNMSG